MKRKGLVLESTNKYVLVLSAEGEYIKVPARGRRYSIGAEIDFDTVSPRRSFLPVLVACAALLLLVFNLAQQLAGRPAAYLFLDINPSIMLSLDGSACIIEAVALNGDGEKVLQGEEEKLKGLEAREALQHLLEGACREGYLASDRDNVILVSLAAPERFRLDREELESSAKESVMQLKLQAYLKVSAAGMTEARNSWRRRVSVNALLLERELEALDKGNNLDGKGSAPSVHDILEGIDPRDIFKPDQLIPGSNRDRHPGTPEPEGDRREDPGKQGQEKPGDCRNSPGNSGGGEEQPGKKEETNRERGPLSYKSVSLSAVLRVVHTASGTVFLTTEKGEELLLKINEGSSILINGTTAGIADLRYRSGTPVRVSFNLETGEILTMEIDR
ncbi:MAG: anti-sigma factor domain-containing protein [Dethiobacteria bacterium]|jgi:hypothetical protein|nr:anti-sigma factor domain-containing protein [Bacillota bacterium]HOP69962.1 anti-sigma factor domain-containing protein [Bacillota bacterium]HPT33301.1 anti-sigma factor domain-containing protein [Bacillota bacterium]HQD05990.1 anti-sigma factor domain-containing protein [Bacillota bacterium]